MLAMVGNHEVMNSNLDFRYVTNTSFAAFSTFRTFATPLSFAACAATADASFAQTATVISAPEMALAHVTHYATLAFR